MFTGLVEGVAEVRRIHLRHAHLEVVLGSDLSCQLSHNQSVAHQGICLSVTEVDRHTHRVTVIQETLKITNASAWREGDLVNLERALSAQGRFEGHIVQGHVDTVATCTRVLAEQTNRVYTFILGQETSLLVERGSVALNGVSLTVLRAEGKTFSVALTPHTYLKTSFRRVRIGDAVNVEFDILGKYCQHLKNA